VRAETLATFRAALAKLRRDAGQSLDEESALLLMARQVLAGSTDAQRASYQIAFTLCEQCRRGSQNGNGEPIAVDAPIIEMAECDARSIGRVDSLPDPDANAHVGAPPHRKRATQSIPPAIRRLVLHRDGARCKVPGCRHTTFVDVHHLRPRSEGGSHDPDSLIVLCGAHHRALHRGLLLAEGGTVKDLVFRHADGSLYGTSVAPRVAAAYAKAFAALRELGFRESEVQRVLTELRAQTNIEHENAEAVLRAALASLTSAH
jgi:hypothetical protein